MKRNLLLSFVSAIFLIFMAGYVNNAMSQEVSLSYKYATANPVRYTVTSTMAQIMDMQGQTMQTDVKAAFGCTVKPAGNKDSNLIFEITVDTLGQTTDSPMGGSGGSVAGIKGKSFNVTVAPDGRMVDMSGAEAFTYALPGSGESNMGQSMGDFFPRLPSVPVKAGDTFNYTDSTITNSPAMKMKVHVVADNKVEGFEKVNGMDCAKIISKVSGTMSMALEAQGMEVFINGPFEGTYEYLFAVKEGYFVTMSNKTVMKGNLDLPSMGMAMPIVINSNSETKAW